MKRLSGLERKRLFGACLILVTLSLFLNFSTFQTNQHGEMNLFNENINASSDLLFFSSHDSPIVSAPASSGDTPPALASIASSKTTKDIDIEIIHISSNFTLSSEVINITHSPKNNEIHIHLKTPSDGRRCKNPTFEGRISGPYLALLQWEHDSIFANPNKTNDFIIGKYQVPSAGVYFIEIIVKLCNSITYSSSFTKQCLEDSRNNRITEIGASITVLAPSNNVRTDSDFPLGFWKWKGDVERNPSKLYVPLLFRFQAAGCWGSNTLECRKAVSLSRFEDYDFVWNDLLIDDSMQFIGAGGSWHRTGDLTQFQGVSETTVCLAGQSHSRNMRGQMEFLNLTQSIKVKFFVALFTRPGQDRDLVKEFTNMKTTCDCNFTVVAVGQWAASFAGNRPFLMYEWDDIMRKIIHAIQLAGSYPIIRLLHKQPVMQRSAMCFPQDWRAHAIPGYNEVLVKIGREMNIPIIDTRFIISPVFDSWADFMHPKMQPAFRESNYVMRELLKITGSV
mmetsp:Transcript_20907/g.41838  ORF Transcript_20907/g.41838 Transcript_20907/m.41838 type:complete len:507 (-) Transcript_20907:24-1544(-)